MFPCAGFGYGFWWIFIFPIAMIVLCFFMMMKMKGMGGCMMGRHNMQDKDNLQTGDNNHLREK